MEKTVHKETLEAFAHSVGGTFSHSTRPTTTLGGMGWSKAEIMIPGPGRPVYFIAFRGGNSAEEHAGFYAEGNLPSGLFCRITQQDGFTRLISTFSCYKMRSGNPGFDKKLHSACNKKDFLLKLSGNREAAGFLGQYIRGPMRFEVMTNEKGLLHDKGGNTMIISLNTNEWITDRSLLRELLAGFRHILSIVG